MRYYETFLSQPVKDGECRAVFEGISLRLSTGRRYTPDWAVFWYPNILEKRVKVELVEVKGGYRLGRYARSRMAFEYAEKEYPAFQFTWHEEQKEART
jgi:hypothetical protein